MNRAILLLTVLLFLASCHQHNQEMKELEKERLKLEEETRKLDERMRELQEYEDTLSAYIRVMNDTTNK